MPQQFLLRFSTFYVIMYYKDICFDIGERTMAKTTIQSVEPNIADLANGWLKSYRLDYKLEQESLNAEIDQALNDYASKNGGVGGNRPDAKLLLCDKNLVAYPILIEYKGYKDKLVKLDGDGKIANKTAKNVPDFKNINSYAVNGAVHYANALLHYTSYTDIIAIGVTGYKDERGELQHSIGVYYVSKSNFGIGQKVDEYTDLSFLKKENFDEFIEKVKRLQLSQEEIDKLKEQREREIDASLIKLNNDIYKDETEKISEQDRVYLVAASIIATIGIPNKVAALEKSELKSSTEEGNRDGDIILRKIKEEEKALEDFNTLRWGKYKMGDLYERIDTQKLPYKAKDLPKEPIDNFILPCLTSSFQNQGLNYYAPTKDATVLSNVISIPSNSDVYRAYYQSRAFTVLSDAYAIRWKSDKNEILPNHYLFMVMCINKVTDLPIYSYKNKLGGWNVVKEKFIHLPEKDGKTDFEFMSTFISAIQKLIIKDVVLYADRKIGETKAIVAKKDC